MSFSHDENVSLGVYTSVIPGDAIRYSNSYLFAPTKSRAKEGVINNMADILQYELFSTCKRLCAEPIVDARTVKNVVFRLCDLAENSPFPSQRARVLEHLQALIHTPHPADLARTALISLLT